MKKFWFSTLLAVVVSLTAQAQILFKISGKDLEKPSYILGSHHLISVGYVDKIAGVNDAFQNTDQVVGELVMADIKDPAKAAAFTSMQLLPDGKLLREVMSKEDYDKLNHVLKTLLGADFSNPMVEQQMGRLKPMALANTLTMVLFLQKHMGEFDPTQPFDGYFQTQALANNEPVLGLETIEEQGKMIFEDISIEEQTKILMCMVNHLDYSAAQTEKLTEAYKKQNLEEMMAVANEKMNNECDDQKSFEDILLTKRNARWLVQIPEIMKAKASFFVVGALHLPGEHGVLQGLKNAGYTVEPVQ